MLKKLFVSEHFLPEIIEMFTQKDTRKPNK